MTEQATAFKSNTPQVRRLLRERGYFPVPITHRGKAPVLPKWQQFEYDIQNPLPLHLPTARGRSTIYHPSTGVRCKGLVAFDIDCEDEQMAWEARSIVEGELGDTPCVRGRDGTYKLALFYRPEPWFEIARKSYRLASQSKFETYTDGNCQMVVHGEHASSTDESPRFYRWEEDPLWDVDRADLPGATILQIESIIQKVVAAMPPPDGPESSLRGQGEPMTDAVRHIMTAQAFHDATTAIAGHMANDGIQPAIIEEYIDYVFANIIVALPDDRRREYFERRKDIKRCVRDIYNKQVRQADSAYAKFGFKTIGRNDR